MRHLSSLASAQLAMLLAATPMRGQEEFVKKVLVEAEPIRGSDESRQAFRYRLRHWKKGSL